MLYSSHSFADTQVCQQYVGKDHVNVNLTECLLTVKRAVWTELSFGSCTALHHNTMRSLIKKKNK